MNTIDTLKHKISQISKDYEFLINENQKLKLELENLKDKNDLFTRYSEDFILEIKNTLKGRDKIE